MVASRKKNPKKPSSPPQETHQLDSGNPTSKKANLLVFDKQKNKDPSIYEPTKIPSKITVREIVESINLAPPFQREQISTQYRGVLVKWTGYLKNATRSPRDEESVHVNLTINQDTSIGYSFWLSEKIVNFPEIRTLKRGSAVSVLGEIHSVSGPGLCADLNPIKIEVLENDA